MQASAGPGAGAGGGGDGGGTQQQQVGTDGSYFETIDIQQPELRIPSPQQSVFARCWQPIGTTVMETAVLKEPRGFMRILQWFFAICAFAACADFSTVMKYDVTCTDKAGATAVLNVSHAGQYPFSLGDSVQMNLHCGDSVTGKSEPPGDFASDAQFFVFTGVVSFLATMALLALYVFFAPIYESEDKKPPLYDFCFTLVIAVFWLSASAAWANGLTGMKSIFRGKWITEEGQLCEMTENGNYANLEIKDCVVASVGHYAGANISVLLGFLNCFLWGSNLWFLYKETSWFSGSGPAPQTDPSPGMQG